jgi:hypothetical protein
VPQADVCVSYRKLRPANLVRIHQTLKITSAMAAKVTDRLWKIGDIVKVREEWENT